MIHSTAIVHPEAQIDSSVEIGPWCTIGKNVTIKKNTKLHSHVVVEGWTEMGENNVVFPFTVLGGVPQDLKYKGEQTWLRIGNDNVIRENVTMNLGTSQAGGETLVGNNCLIMASTHLGHDCKIGNHCILANATGLAGHVTIEDYVILGGMTGVSQFVQVGTHSYVGGYSALDRDIPPFTIAMGNRPCLIKGTNIVGLRRRGFPTETIQKINEAVKLWIRPDIQKEQCLLEIDSQYGEYPEVQQLIAFIRKSEVGVARS